MRVHTNVLFTKHLHLSLIYSTSRFYLCSLSTHREMESNEVVMIWYTCNITKLLLVHYVSNNQTRCLLSNYAMTYGMCPSLHIYIWFSCIPFWNYIIVAQVFMEKWNSMRYSWGSVQVTLPSHYWWSRFSNDPWRCTLLDDASTSGCDCLPYL